LRNIKIKILGPGCPKCKTLERITREAVAETDIDATIEKVEDIVKIIEYHVMHTPVLVINEKVLLSGQVPTVNQVKLILTKYQS